jgi:hypothetical protein
MAAPPSAGRAASRGSGGVNERWRGMLARDLLDRLGGAREPEGPQMVSFRARLRGQVVHDDRNARPIAHLLVVVQRLQEARRCRGQILLGERHPAKGVEGIRRPEQVSGGT